MRASRITATLLCLLAPELAFAESNTIGRVSARQEGARTIVTIHGSTTPSFTAYRLDRPDRVVVDLADSRLSTSEGPISVDTWAVSQISMAQYQDERTRTARVMIAFRRGAGYDARPVANDVVVTITPNETPPAEALKSETARLEEVRGKRTLAEAEARAVEERRTRAEAALKAIEAQQAQAARGAEQSRKQIAAVEQARAQAEEQLKALETARQSAERARAEEEQRLKALRDARAEEERRAQRQSEVRKAEAEASTKAEAARRDAELAKARAEAARTELERVIEARKKDVARIEQMMRTAPAELERLQAQRQQEERRLEAARAEADRLAKARAEEARKLAEEQATVRRLAEERAARLEETRRAAEKRQQAQEEARLAEERRARAQAEEAERLRAAAEAARRLKTTESAVKQAEGKAAAAARLAAEQQDRIEAFKAEALKAEKDAGQARAQAEQARREVDKLITQHKDELARAEAARAEATRIAQARASDLDKARHAAAIASGSTARVEAAEREARKAAEDRARESQRMEVVRKELDDAARARAGELRRLEDARAASRREVEEKESQLKGLRKERAEEEARLHQARSAQAQLEQDVRKLEALKATTQRDMEREIKEQARRDKEARAMEARLEAARTELERVKASTKEAATGGRIVAQVKNVRFAADDDAHRVILDVTGDPDCSMVRSDGKSAVLRVAGANLPKKLERTLDATAYEGPVRMVSTYPDPTQPGAVRVEVALAQGADGAAPRLLRDRGQVTLEFPRARASSYASPRVGGYGVPTLPLQVKEAAQDSLRQTTSMPASSLQRRKKAYTGRRIDLDFKDADIHNILRLLSEVGQVNIVTSDDVKGAVTIRMRDVPWDQALDVILRSKGLGMQREANLLRVAPNSVLEKELEAEIARQKQSVELKPLDTRLIPLSYADADKLMPRIQDVLSQRGKVSVDQRTNMLIVSDVSGNIALAEDLVRNLDTQTPQVLIESRIVEARSTFQRTIGIQWGGNTINSTATGNPTGIVFPSTIGMAGGSSTDQTNGLQNGQAASPNYVVNLPAPVGTGSGGAVGITLGSVTGNLNINLRLSSLENTGQVRIVSAPKIMTLDNIEASIEQGYAIPISVVSAAGTNTVFVDAKLNLTVTPHVTNEGSVVMKVKIMRNEPDFVNTAANGTPTILKREARTMMLVRDGDTAVIGGIYSRNAGVSHAKIPWFGDIPVLGWLFKNRRENDDRIELLIFITPRIVNRQAVVAR